MIAANVDVVGIVSAFGEGKSARDRRLINEPRVRRFLAVAEQSRAQPILIVNKIDLSTDPQAVTDPFAQTFPGIPVVLTSALTGLGLDGLGPWLPPGKTLALIGMSGVGKSTLVNALVGRATQRTGEVRESDARGRHTTTHRELDGHAKRSAPDRHAGHARARGLGDGGRQERRRHRPGRRQSWR